jgi:hypothetical protein
VPIDDAKEYSQRREIIAATGDVIKLQREEFRAVAAACCVPAIVIVLVCGLVVGQPFTALVATAGAFSVGFGLFQRLSSFTGAPMLLALVGMTISATIGTLASASPLSEGIAAAIWAFGVAAAGLAPVWWIALQWSIALVIAAAFPADPTFALLRGLLVALGGTLQLVLASSLCSGSSERERPPSLPRIGAVGASRNLGTGHRAVSLCCGPRGHGRHRSCSLSGCRFFERLLDRDDDPDRAAFGIARHGEDHRDPHHRHYGRRRGCDNHRLFSAAVANHLGGADRRDGVGVLCVIARQLCSVQHVDHRVHRPAVCLWGSAGSRPWHCIGSVPPRSAAVSRLPHIFFTSPVLRAVHRHLALEPVLLGARRPGAREAFERLRRNKAVP